MLFAGIDWNQVLMQGLIGGIIGAFVGLVVYLGNKLSGADKKKPDEQ